MFVYYQSRAEASNQINANETSVSPALGEEKFFSYNTEYYLAKKELEEYPKTPLPEPEKPAQPPVYRSAAAANNSNAKVIPSTLSAKTRCSCVEGARHFSGINVGFMSEFGPGIGAKQHPTGIAYPAVGAIVVTNESDWGHVATITFVAPDFSYFEVIETNYYSCAVTTRKIYTDSPTIIGFYWQYVSH